MRGLTWVLTIVLGLYFLAPFSEGKDKKKKPAPKPPQDAIEVVGHVSLTAGVVTGFVPTQHYSSYYLYVEYGSGKDVTLIDVTKESQPSVLADVPFPTDTGGSASLFAVAGTAALTTEGKGSPLAPASQTIRILDFSDPQHPKIEREFDGVTAITKDARRGLIFLANPEGLWILRQSFAEDPEVEKAYAHRILYDR